VNEYQCLVERYRFSYVYRDDVSTEHDQAHLLKVQRDIRCQLGPVERELRRRGFTVLPSPYLRPPHKFHPLF
jgi:hypothetical protein